MVSNNFDLVGLLLLNKLGFVYTSPNFPSLRLSVFLPPIHLCTGLDLLGARHFAKWWRSDNQPYLARAE